MTQPHLALLTLQGLQDIFTISQSKSVLPAVVQDHGECGVHTQALFMEPLPDETADPGPQDSACQGHRGGQDP